MWKLTDDEKKLFDDLHQKYKANKQHLLTQIKTKRQLTEVIAEYSLRVHHFDYILWLGYTLKSDEPIKRTALQIAEDINEVLDGEFTYDDGTLYTDWQEFDVVGGYKDINIKVSVSFFGSDQCKYVEETITQRVLVCPE